MNEKVDDTESGSGESQSPSEEIASDSKIKELGRQVEDLTNQWKRALADYQNLEKRVERDRADWVKFSKLELFGRLLGVLDDLERARRHLVDRGLDLVVDRLREILVHEGLKEIEVFAGDDFDPNFQDCVEVVKGELEQKVVEVIAKGYIIDERVVRPAKVKVSKKEVGEISPEADQEIEAGDYV